MLFCRLNTMTARQDLQISSMQDLLSIDNGGRLYRMLLDPFTWFLSAYAAVFAGLWMSYGPSGVLSLELMMIPAVTAIAACVFCSFIQDLLFWSDFGPNWTLVTRCTIHGQQYSVVRDGARSLRVYYLQGSIAHGLSSDSVQSKAFIDWLKHERPRGATACQ